MYTYAGDKWSKKYGSPLMGRAVRVVRWMPRRRVLVELDGTTYLTFAWCLRRQPTGGTAAKPAG